MYIYINVYGVDINGTFHIPKSQFYPFLSSSCSIVLLQINPIGPTSSSTIQSSCALQSILTLVCADTALAYATPDPFVTKPMSSLWHSKHIGHISVGSSVFPWILGHNILFFCSITAFPHPNTTLGPWWPQQYSPSAICNHFCCNT